MNRDPDVAPPRSTWFAWLDDRDRRVTRWMARHGPRLLRFSVAGVFLWFGALKFVPGLSAADDLATRTISALSFDTIPAHISRPLLAVCETAIGLGLLLAGRRGGAWLRATLLLLAMQMLGTLTPLVLFPAETWKIAPIVPTLEGQYILKNAVIVAAAIVIGSMARGGRIVSDPGPGASSAHRT